MDGLEEVLKPTNEESGKIIDNTSCYIATITNSENAKNAKVGQKVEIRLPSNEETRAEITEQGI